MTSAGLYRLRDITTEEATEVVSVYDSNEIVSYIGHESTAQIMSELLGINVAVNRAEYTHVRADVCLCFKLNTRPTEGQILSREEVEAIGFSFKLMSYLP
jgi:hypothetical protein